MLNNSKYPSDSLPEDEMQNLEPEELPAVKINLTFNQIWNKIIHFGLGEPTVRIATAVASIVLIFLVVWVMSRFFLPADKNSTAVNIPTPQATV